MKLRRSVLLAALLLSTAAGAEERWYTFSMAGTPVGYVSETMAGGVTETVVFARLTRLGKSIEMRFATTAREKTSGELEELTYEALLSKQATRLSAKIEGEKIRITAGEHERVIDRGPHPLLGPAGVARRTREKLAKEEDSIEYFVFSPELQNVVRVRRRVLAASERIACSGAAAMKIEESLEGMPAPRILWTDSTAATVADEIPGPFGAMTSCRSTREAALAANGTLPADLYERTLARANVRLADAAAVDRIVLRITPRDPSIPLPDFRAHNQRVDGNTVEIRRPAAPATAERERPGETMDEFLAPNALVESSHPDIVKTAGEIADAEPDAYKAALALTRWVAGNMSMNAGIVMAPASELIRDRKATCVGYATLLAALARANGIPSRIAMGYVYYGGIWGGHAWTELRLDGRWLPFDAAVYAPGVASATRLAAGVSSFHDGGGALNAALAALFGRVEIETLAVEANGRVTRTADLVPFRIAGATYVNPGLGLRVPADGWAIERADSTWPSTLVVAFRRGETIIELHQKQRYPSAAVEAGDGAVFAVPEGATLWTWSATGPDAAGALQRFLSRIERK